MTVLGRCCTANPIAAIDRIDAFLAPDAPWVVSAYSVINPASRAFETAGWS